MIKESKLESLLKNKTRLRSKVFSLEKTLPELSEIDAKKILGPKNIYKKFWVKKIWVRKNHGSEKHFGSKQYYGSKKIVGQNI